MAENYFQCCRTFFPSLVGWWLSSSIRLIAVPVKAAVGERMKETCRGGSAELFLQHQQSLDCWYQAPRALVPFSTIKKGRQSKHESWFATDLFYRVSLSSKPAFSCSPSRPTSDCGAAWWDFIPHLPSLGTAACSVLQKNPSLCFWLWPTHAAAGRELPVQWSADGQIRQGLANSSGKGEWKCRGTSEKCHVLNNVRYCLTKEMFCLAILFCTAKFFCKIGCGLLYSYYRWRNQDVEIWSSLFSENAFGVVWNKSLSS